MKRSRIFEFIGIIGAIASIFVVLDAYVIKSPFVDRLLEPVTMSTLSLSILFGLMSLLLFLSGRYLNLYTRHRIIRSGSETVMRFVRANKLLHVATNIDFCHYTAETVLIPWRGDLEKHDKPLNIRLFVRRPETDERKHSLAEGSLDTTHEITQSNSNIKIDIRFYNHDPLLRLQFYRSDKIEICLAGIYKYDAMETMRFIGAEKNAMLILKPNRKNEDRIINAFYSRFEEQWNKSSCLRGVIFDMDGVLMDSMECHLKSWREAFEEERIQFNYNTFLLDIYYLEGLKAEQTVRKIYLKYTKDEPTDEIINRIIKFKKERHLFYMQTVEPFDGIVDILKYLKSMGVPLAIVTGTTSESVIPTIERLFSNIFDVIITGSDVKQGKPNPESYETAVKKLRIEKRNQCLVVENAPLGVQAAVAAGIPVFGILMNSPLQPRDLENVGAVRVFSNTDDLKRAISSLKFGELKISSQKGS